MLSEWEKQVQGKLPGISDLSRDVFQSLFSMNVKEKPEDVLSPMAKKFHRPILRQLMRSPVYPAIRAICEGNELPAYDATEEFMRQIIENLDRLMDAANGPKQSLSVLEKETAKQEERLEQLGGQRCRLGSFWTAGTPPGWTLSWKRRYCGWRTGPTAKYASLPPWRRWWRITSCATRSRWNPYYLLQARRLWRRPTKRRKFFCPGGPIPEI